VTSPVTAKLATGPSPRRRRRPLMIFIIVVVVLLGLLVGADFATRAYAESRIASQIQQQGFPEKPSVVIDGFPFLTQAARRDFSEIQISAGPLTRGALQIQAIDLTMDGVHVNSALNGGTVNHLTANLSVTFTALASAMTAQGGSSLGSALSGGLTLSQAGSDEVKATLNLPLIGNQVAVWKRDHPPDGVRQRPAAQLRAGTARHHQPACSVAAVRAEHAEHQRHRGRRHRDVFRPEHPLRQLSSQARMALSEAAH
jgi:hypothetical protein